VVIACRAERADASPITAGEAPVGPSDLPSSAEGGASGSVTDEPGTAKDEQTHVFYRASLTMSGQTPTRVRQPCVRRVNFAGASWGVLKDISAGQVSLQRSDLYVGLT
jgi:hypothetical protein